MVEPLNQEPGQTSQSEINEIRVPKEQECLLKAQEIFGKYAEGIASLKTDAMQAAIPYGAERVIVLAAAGEAEDGPEYANRLFGVSVAMIGDNQLEWTFVAKTLPEATFKGLVDPKSGKFDIAKKDQLKELLLNPEDFTFNPDKMVIATPRYGWQESDYLIFRWGKRLAGEEGKIDPATLKVAGRAITGLDVLKYFGSRSSANEAEIIQLILPGADLVMPGEAVELGRTGEGPKFVKFTTPVDTALKTMLGGRRDNEKVLAAGRF